MNGQNQILTSLSADARDRLASHCNSVALAQGDVMYRPGETLTYLYFPITCIFSITITMQDGAIAEVGMIGSREVLGIHAFLSKQDIIQTEYVVQVPGDAVKIAASVLRQEFDRNGELRDVLLRYAQALVAQISQTAVCNSLHTLEQRLPRWLLEVQSRISSDGLPLTQEFIATMLGVRRAGVTQMAQRLQERKLIRYKRGHVQIVNQAGLEASACECFKTVKRQYDRLLGSQPF